MLRIGYQHPKLVTNTNGLQHRTAITTSRYGIVDTYIGNGKEIAHALFSFY